MADLDVNIITVLEANATISAASVEVFVNRTPESVSGAYIWIQLDDEFDETDIAGGAGPVISTFDIECCSTDIHESKDLQKAVKTELHGMSGTFGDQKVAYAEISSKDDTYESRQPGDLQGLHVSALTLEIGVDSRS